MKRTADDELFVTISSLETCEEGIVYKAVHKISLQFVGLRVVRMEPIED